MNAQEAFWSGDFGRQYNKRSPGSAEANYHFFRKALGARANESLRSVCELGCGTGSNLQALRRLLPKAELFGVEINNEAADHAAEHGHVFRRSLLDWMPTRAFDLAFTKGVLIHIAPENLSKAYGTLWASAKRYILIAEYFNPTPVEVDYRGHAGRLWKRDFAGEMLDTYGDLRLLDYGFVWRRDPHAQDDLNWTLMEKRP